MTKKGTRFHGEYYSLNTIYNKETINYFIKTKYRNGFAELLAQAIDSISLKDSKRGVIHFSGSIKFDLDGWSEKSEKYFK